MSAKQFLNVGNRQSGQKASRQTKLCPLDEEAIWNDFLNGDNAALSSIYCEYADKLYNYGRQFAGEDVVQDCIQDLFYDLIRSRKKLSKINSLKAYLYSSLRRKVARKLKQENKEIGESWLEANTKFRITFVQDNANFHFDRDIAGADKQGLFQSRIHILRDACNRLPARQREAIMLRFFEKLSYEDVTNVMNFGKVSSTRILVHRAIDSLRKLLSGKREELIPVLLFLFSNFDL